jgi:hypothetical protein
MKSLIVIISILISGCTTTYTGGVVDTSKIIYTTNKYGEIQYHKPALKVMR